MKFPKFQTGILLNGKRPSFPEALTLILLIFDHFSWRHVIHSNLMKPVLNSADFIKRSFTVFLSVEVEVETV